MVYFSETARQAVRRYKYAGGDLSLIYIYLLTPMNEFLIEFFPRWLAPNVITTLGLVFTGSACLVSSYYSPTFAEPLPSWACFYIGVCLFVYQTLDNLDGKQARRTGSSSPLGLLFDHGIDAVNITVGTMSLLAVVRAGPINDLLVYWMVAIAPFFFHTWEEYYVGALVLPIVNGPTDGVVFSILLCFLQGAGVIDLGAPIVQNFPFASRISFMQPYLLNPTNHIIFFIICVACILTCALCTYGVFKWQLQQGKGIAGPLGGMYRASPFIMHMTFLWLWVHNSREAILPTYPRMFLLANGLVNCHVVCMLMLAHICEEKYWPKATAVVIIPVFLAVVNSVGLSQPLVSERMALTLLLIWSFGCWFHMVYNVINELTEILNIRCFSLNAPERPRKAGDVDSDSESSDDDENEPLLSNGPASPQSKEKSSRPSFVSVSAASSPSSSDSVRSRPNCH